MLVEWYKTQKELQKIEENFLICPSTRCERFPYSRRHVINMCVT